MDDARRPNALVCPAYQGYPRSQWYVVAFSHEVKRELLQRRVPGDLMVMYRAEDGTPVAQTVFRPPPHRPS